MRISKQAIMSDYFWFWILDFRGTDFSTRFCFIKRKKFYSIRIGGIIFNLETKRRHKKN